LRGGLRAVYRCARDFYLAGGDAPRGCFLLGTAVTEANRDPEMRAIVEETMASFTATFAERFERAEHDGELSPHAPDALANRHGGVEHPRGAHPHRRIHCGP
jgi:hypothetical protein